MYYSRNKVFLPVAITVTDAPLSSVIRSTDIIEQYHNYHHNRRRHRCHHRMVFGRKIMCFIVYYIVIHRLLCCSKTVKCQGKKRITREREGERKREKRRRKKNKRQNDRFPIILGRIDRMETRFLYRLTGWLAVGPPPGRPENTNRGA